MLKKWVSFVSFACAMYSMPREDKACASMCACNHMALLKKTAYTTQNNTFGGEPYLTYFLLVLNYITKFHVWIKINICHSLCKGELSAVENPTSRNFYIPHTNTIMKLARNVYCKDILSPLQWLHMLCPIQ